MDRTARRWGLGKTHDTLRFDLGKLYWTSRALEFLSTLTDDPTTFCTPYIMRHAQGDYGDAAQRFGPKNEEAIQGRPGGIVISTYPVGPANELLLVMTTFEEHGTFVMVKEDTIDAYDRRIQQLTLDVEDDP